MRGKGRGGEADSRLSTAPGERTKKKADSSSSKASPSQETRHAGTKLACSHSRTHARTNCAEWGVCVSVALLLAPPWRRSPPPPPVQEEARRDQIHHPLPSSSIHPFFYTLASCSVQYLKENWVSRKEAKTREVRTKEKKRSKSELNRRFK